ncbi:DUF3182 family protein [Variovorax sp. HJSM1_2]|uniref:DUF3182 family protein n=1 Tax=Variovorax sp. HJSM1_2 TaxID=3366263 RepID=UPI003BE25F6F
MFVETLQRSAIRSPLRSNEDLGVVMPYTQGLPGQQKGHEAVTRREIARRIARLKGYRLADELPQPSWPERTYLVPCETLVGLDHAQSLGIRGADDFFGGLVPEAFVASKAISHPLYSPEAVAPRGWSPDFYPMVAKAVLPGYTAFSREDAALAAERLLPLGAMRIKPVSAAGGRGQTVVHDRTAFNALLAVMDNQELRSHGVVLEHELSDVETLSVGQVSVAGIVASYFGRQLLTPDQHGALVYGGADLMVVRGGFDVLLATLPSGAVRTAVEHALVYDMAVRACFPGFCASRAHYDVVHGFNAVGQRCSGVLQPSWHMGAASAAEMAALEAFHADKGLKTLRASCFEKFGPYQALPEYAVVYFQGEDPDLGPLTKYAVLDLDGYSSSLPASTLR